MIWYKLSKIYLTDKSIGAQSSPELTADLSGLLAAMAAAQLASYSARRWANSRSCSWKSLAAAAFCMSGCRAKSGERRYRASGSNSGWLKGVSCGWLLDNGGLWGSGEGELAAEESGEGGWLAAWLETGETEWRLEPAAEWAAKAL